MNKSTSAPKTRNDCALLKMTKENSKEQENNKVSITFICINAYIFMKEIVENIAA